MKGDTHAREFDRGLRDWGYETSYETVGIMGSMSRDSFYTDYLAEKGLLDTHREYLRTYARAGGQEYNLGESKIRIFPWEVPPCVLPSEDHIDMFVARKSAEWIKSYRGDKPFYLQVCFPGPHNPFDSPSEYRAMYRPEDMPLAILDKPAPPVAPYVSFRVEYSLGPMTECHNRVMKTYYYGKLTLIDDGINLILKALEEKGLLDNTWIIYTSDHGELLGDHRISGKVVFYEGALSIPCIIRPPGGIKGWKSKGLTDLLDVAATIIEIAGAKPFTGSDGRSLVPKIQAGANAPEAQLGKEAIFSEIDGYSMVRTERYKMAVAALTREPIEFYDLETDPDELHNRVNDPILEKVRQELLDTHLNRLLSHLDKTTLAEFEQTKTK